jgi:iron complex outermembrane receptor protein
MVMAMRCRKASSFIFLKSKIKSIFRKNIEIQPMIRLITNTVLSISLMLLICSSDCAIAQDRAILVGKVLDAKSGQTLPGVTVGVSGTTLGTITDIEGTYRLELIAKEQTIEFRFLGYTSQSRIVNPAAGQTLQLDMRLEPESKLLDVVVVSAGKFEQKLEEVTVSMAVIKPALIENTNATSVDLVMEQVPGVNILDGQANIRGGSGFSYGAGSRVLLLVDDLPMVAADAGDVKWSFLPVENIDQIEVIKGASSALFGSSAMNGVINVRTAYPKAKPETRLSWFSGWYGDTKREQLQWWGKNLQQFGGISFSHMQQAGNLDLVAAGNAYHDEGYRFGEDERRYRMNFNTRYRFQKAKGLSVGLNANITFTQGGNFLIWQNDSTGAYQPLGGLDPATTTLSRYDTRRTSIDPFVTYVKANGTSHKLRLRYFSSDNRNNTNQQSLASAYFAEYQYQCKIGEHTNLTGGLTSTFYDVNSELFNDHDASNFAAFAQADWNYGRFSLSLGGRVEANRIDKEAYETVPVLRSGINFRAAEHTYFRASYGQGYRYPSIAEKFTSTRVGSIVIYPNDSVTSETGETAEFGLKQGFRVGGFEGYLDVAAFWSEYKDMMEFTFGKYGTQSDPLFGLGFKSKNIGNTRITGFEIELVGGGFIGKVPVSILGGFTYIEPIALDFDSSKAAVENSADFNILKYRYRRVFKMDMEANPGKWILGGSVRYNSFMDNIDKFFEETIQGLRSYREIHNYGDWVFDFRTGYQINKNFRIMLIVRNLFNHEYMGRPADMQPPRSFTMQLSAKF